MLGIPVSGKPHLTLNQLPLAKTVRHTQSTQGTLLQKTSPLRLGEQAFSSNAQNQAEKVIQNEAEEYVPNDRKRKTKKLNETELTDLPGRV